MSARPQLFGQRAALYASLLFLPFAMQACTSNAPRNQPGDEAVVAEPQPVAAAVDSPATAAAQQPAEAPPETAAPDAVRQQEPATPRPQPAEPVRDQAAAASPAARSPVPRAPAASRPVAHVVQGLAQLQMEAQLVPADYLRAQLVGREFDQQAFTSSSGEFFFKEVPAGSYVLLLRTVGKDERPVYNSNVAIGSGDLVRIGPFHIPIEAVKGR